VTEEKWQDAYEWWVEGGDSHDLFKGAVPAFPVEIERNYRPSLGLWDLPWFCWTIHSMKFVGSWKGPFVPAGSDVGLTGDVVRRVLVECCSGACASRMRRLPGDVGLQCGSWLAAWSGARASERRRLTGVPVTRWVGYGHRRVEAASCPWVGHDRQRAEAAVPGAV
jgi:hypothetical protein